MLLPWSWWLSELRRLLSGVIHDQDMYTGVMGSNPTAGMAGLHTLGKPLVNCIINQMYS